MKEPDHKVKRHVVPFSNKQKPYWVENPVHGWLSSGVKDKNGTEIFNGDIVRADGERYTINFRDGCFFVGKEMFLYYFEPDEIEIVGHVAEENCT